MLAPPPTSFSPIDHLSHARARPAITRSGGWFPVAFASWLDGAPFRISALFLLVYITTPYLADPIATYLKYLLTSLLLVCFALLAVTRPINLSLLFPLAPLTLAFLGGLSLAYSVVVSPDTTTYSSGLIPLIITAMPLLIPSGAAWTDSHAMMRYLLWISTVAAVSHVLLQAATGVLGWEDGSEYYGSFRVPGLDGTFSIVCLMLLSGLSRKNRLLALSIVLTGLTSVFRPTSTLIFAALFAIMIIALHRLQLYRLVSRACIVLVISILLCNLLILESPAFTEALYSIEPMVKEQALESNSNNEFRLGVLKAARDELAQYPPLIGKAFSGDITVDPRTYLPWLHGELEPIHSDFIIVLAQGGLIGYGLFACLFLGMARLCASGARYARAFGDSKTETLFIAFQAMNVTFMAYISAQPALQVLQYTLLYLMLFPLAIFMARSQAQLYGWQRVSWRGTQRSREAGGPT